MKYTKPKLRDLNSPDSAEGAPKAPCAIGSGDGTCMAGPGANASCNSGPAAIVACNTLGNSAGGDCTTGTAAGPG